MSCCCCCDSLPQAQLPALTQELTKEEVNAMNDAVFRIYLFMSFFPPLFF